MKFVLFVEGHTERKCLQMFLKGWLDPRISQPVRMKVVRFNGWQDLAKDASRRAQMYLEGPDCDDIIGVVALLDLYGPTFYPHNAATVRDRVEWARSHLEGQLCNPRFRFFLAVHETEAWLLSDPLLFPSAVRRAFPARVEHPEEVNCREPPSKLLDRLYRSKLGSGYKKLTHGRDLFSRLNPQTAYGKCPELKSMLDTMLELARAAGQ